MNHLAAINLQSESAGSTLLFFLLSFLLPILQRLLLALLSSAALSFSFAPLCGIDDVIGGGVRS